MREPAHGPGGAGYPRSVTYPRRGPPHAVTPSVPRALGRRERRRLRPAGAHVRAREREAGAAAEVGPVRGGRGVGRPGPAGDHAVDARRGARAQGQRAARGRARQELPARRGPRPRRDEPRQGRQRQGARDGPQALRAVLLPLRDQGRLEPGRPLPHGPAGRLPSGADVRLLLLPGLHARLLQRARADGARGHRLLGLPRRLHLRRELPHDRRRHRRARRHDRRHDVQRPPARRHDARRLPRQVRAVPLRRGAAQGPGARPDGRDLGRPRGAEQLRGRRPGRRPAGRRALQRAAPGGRLQGVVRVDAHVRQEGRPDLPAAQVRQDDGPDHARPAPVPRRPAVRRRGHAGLRRAEEARATCWAASR